MVSTCHGLTCVPQQAVFKTQPSVHVNVTLVGNIVFADVMKSSFNHTHHSESSFSDWCPCKRRETWIQMHTHRGEGHLMAEAEVGVMLLPAKEHQVVPAPTRS